MAQGKMKIKTKLPDNIKKKNKPKGGAVTKSKNCPVRSKKDKMTVADKLKNMVTKNLNKAIDEDLKAKIKSKQTLSKAQEAVAKYNTSKGQ